MIPVVHTMRTQTKSRVVRLINYVTSDNGEPERVGDVFITNCGAVDPFIVSKEMEAVQGLNTRSGADKTYHLSVSFPIHEKPSREQLEAIEAHLAKELGYEQHQRITVVHNDTDNTHIHMVINKIHPEKYTIHTPKNDHGILAKVCTQLEREFSLSFDNHSPSKSHAEARITSFENKSGVESFATYARVNAETAIESSKSWSEFHETLAIAGVFVQLRGNGLVFVNHTGEYAAKGSSLGREYSKSNLEKKLGNFEATPEKFRGLNFSTVYEEKPRFGEKSLFNEYKEMRRQATEDRKIRMEELKKAQEKAIADIKDTTARSERAEKFGGIFRTKRLQHILAKQEEDKLTKAIKVEFEAKREAIWQAKITDYNEWVKEKALSGHDRAVFSFVEKADREEKNRRLAILHDEQAKAIFAAKRNAVALLDASTTPESLIAMIAKQREKKLVGAVIEEYKVRGQELKKALGDSYAAFTECQAQLTTCRKERADTLAGVKEAAGAVVASLEKQPRTDRERQWQLLKAEKQLTKEVYNKFQGRFKQLREATTKAYAQITEVKALFAEHRKEGSSDECVDDL